MDDHPGHKSNSRRIAENPARGTCCGSCSLRIDHVCFVVARTSPSGDSDAIEGRLDAAIDSIHVPGQSNERRETTGYDWKILPPISRIEGARLLRGV